MSRSLVLKFVGALLTMGFAAGAIAIGAGAPVSPAQIARVTREAADNLKVAKENTEQAASDTEALAIIAENVGAQLVASRRLLTIQLGIEKSSRRGLDGAKTVVERIDVVGETLALLVDRLRSVSSMSDRITSSSLTARSAAGELQETLDRLIGRYEVAVNESRKLNRKARAYEELPP